jgi:hypothetical protein
MRLDEGAGLVGCGKVWMIWQTAAASRVRLRIRQDQPQQPQRATLQRSL